MTSACVLIPAYEPDEKLVALVTELRPDWRVILVDDGSGEACASIFSQCEALGAAVLRHSVNRGKGAAMKTGLAYCMETFPGVSVVTADADGQHTPEDIGRVAAAMEANPGSLVLGARNFKKMPPRSRTGNTLTLFFFRYFTGLRITDTQTGLRGLPAARLSAFLDIPGDRYEYEMNMLLSLKEQSIPYMEIPISTIYIDNNASTHFHALRDGLRVFSRVIRYAVSSLVSTAVDFGLYWLFLHWLTPAFSYIAARVLSSILNYECNRRVVFRAPSTLQSLLGYFGLAAAVMFSGSYLVTLLTHAGLSEMLSKLLVDSALFILNYILQKKVVFRKKS